MNCPKCKAKTLASATVRSIEVDRCTECGGIWCDRGELSDLLNLEPGLAARIDRAKERPEQNQVHGRCPRDNESLLRIYSSQDHSVVLDVCTHCAGIWLDAGELKRLATGGAE